MTPAPNAAPDAAPNAAPGPQDGADTLAIRRHLEDRERLMYTSRTLSVTEMASTLAHELNQPLGTVINVLLGLKARLVAAGGGSAAALDAAALARGVGLALDQAQFAAAIVSRIRNYTHARQPRGEALDLAQVVQESVALLDWEIDRAAIVLRVDLAAGCAVIGDRLMLQQVVVNLMRNALDAMRDAPPARRLLQLRLGVQPGGRDALLAIRDSGCGLPPDAEQRLFVPFQSTKPNGMGIGLSICRSLVELHQGRLWFSRNDADGDGGGPGCTFHVALPRAAAGAAGPSA